MTSAAHSPEMIAKQLYPAQATAACVANAAAFGKDDIERYQRDGFIAVANVFTADEIEAAQDGLRQLISDADPDIISFEDTADLSGPMEGREALVRKCMGFVAREPRLNAMAMHPKLLGMVQALIGSEVALLQDMALLKPPFLGREKPWHQDSAYFDYGPADLLIGTWTALDPATIENGCMHLIPGSHRAGGRAHYKDRDCQLPDDAVEVEHSIAAPLAPGSVLFFSALLHHGTPPNRSAAPRKAVQFHYRSIDAKRLSLAEFQTMFHDSAGVAGCAGAYGEGMVRAMDSRMI
jgi:phytanoyl-CoA hydroxylase